jgi:hypothetical protein
MEGILQHAEFAFGEGDNSPTQAKKMGLNGPPAIL